MKAHGLLERDGRHYAYRFTDKGLKVSLLFRKRICGPFATAFPTIDRIPNMLKN